jgi:hypothetical protein
MSTTDVHRRHLWEGEKRQRKKEASSDVLTILWRTLSDSFLLPHRRRHCFEMPYWEDRAYNVSTGIVAIKSKRLLRFDLPARNDVRIRPSRPFRSKNQSFTDGCGPLWHCSSKINSCVLLLYEKHSYKTIGSSHRLVSRQVLLMWLLDWIFHQGYGFEKFIFQCSDSGKKK